MVTLQVQEVVTSYKNSIKRFKMIFTANIERFKIGQDEKTQEAIYKLIFKDSGGNECKNYALISISEDEKTAQLQSFEDEI